MMKKPVKLLPARLEGISSGSTSKSVTLHVVHVNDQGEEVYYRVDLTEGQRDLLSQRLVEAKNNPDSPEERHNQIWKNLGPDFPPS